jgi:branched-chain amino acid aminotransferase
MGAVVWINGRLARGDEAVVSVFDHGFLYGDGVYETLRTYAGDPFLFARHVRRLRRSAEMMTLPVPFSDTELLGRVRETIEAHDRPKAEGPRPKDDGEKYIRVVLTRGVGELSYRLDACPAPTLVVIVKALEAPPDESFSDGVTVALVDVRRNHPQALNPMIKSNNLLNNALAMQEAIRSDAEEALMRNQHGDLVECSQSNFFVVRDGAVLTPPLAAGLLPGITREFVLELADELGVPAREERLMPDDLRTADEAFITGTTREVTPVVRVDDLTIARGVPGAISQRLLAEYRARAEQLSTRRA